MHTMKILFKYRFLALCLSLAGTLSPALVRETFAQVASKRTRKRAPKIQKQEPIQNPLLEDEGPAPGLEALDRAVEMGRKPKEKDKSRWGFHSLVIEGVGGFAQVSEGDPLSQWGAGLGLGFGLHKNFRFMLGIETLPDRTNSIGRDERGSLIATSLIYRMAQGDLLPGFEFGATAGSMSWNSVSAWAFGALLQYGYRFEDLGITPVVRTQYLFSSDRVGGNVLQVYGGILFERDF
jgi:hypothetical protein